MISLFALIVISATNSGGVREIKATACDISRINVGVGMTTQIVFDSEPTMTLMADQQHFLVQGSKGAKRSIAIIPRIDPGEIKALWPDSMRLPTMAETIAAVDRAFRTNLFVFFNNSRQLMFELRFVEKPKVDFVVRVQEVFKKGCPL